MWSNFHTHTSYCDGKVSVAGVVESAQAQGLGCLGISSHAPLPFPKPWAMKQDEFASYLKDISLCKSNCGAMQIYAGLEVDFVPGQISPGVFSSSLDYTVGSVHFVDQYSDGSHWEIDNTADVFNDGLENIFHGNAKHAVSRYFELTRQMLDESPPDILGHLDKIKIQNVQESYFREDDAWYIAEVKRTIDSIERAGIVVEISTRGIYQGKSTSTYPSPWIIELLHQRNIPVTWSSDAHHPKDLVTGFAEVSRMLSKIGFKTIHVLNNGAWTATKFNERGIVQ